MNSDGLLKGLNGLSPSVLRLFTLMPISKLDWSPQKGMRTLIEVANHLAQIPSVDLTILREAPLQEVQELERALFRENVIELASVWGSGLDTVERFYRALSTEEYCHKIGTSFYGHRATLEEWLLEIITHGYHHRSQLFIYLKMLGEPVDMHTLYLEHSEQSP